tara:strand:- start:404 stop:760 length:357 start_codon:yes stop_codon:yes gene_type:complete
MKNALLLSLALIAVGCGDPTDVEMTEDPLTDQALNGAWVDGVQSGAVKVYINELRFDNGSFEYWWDNDLQQRGVYDTQAGILTVTIQNNYGRKVLSDYSSPYSISGDTLTWRRQYTKK